MKADHESAFLGRVRKALGRPGGVRPAWTGLRGREADAATLAELARIRGRSREERLGLLARLESEAVPLKLTVRRVTDARQAAQAVVDLVAAGEPEWGGAKRVVGWRHPLITALDLGARLAQLAVPYSESDPALEGQSSEDRRERRAALRREVADAFVGVTAADYAVAATGTLALKTRPGQARSVSLLPTIHVAVIYLDQIVADLRELYLLLEHDPGGKTEGLTNCLTFISGPSKTGDIEFIMIHGVHGPREMHLLVITDEAAP